MRPRTIVPPAPLLLRILASRGLFWTATRMVRLSLWITPEIEVRNQSTKAL